MPNLSLTGRHWAWPEAGTKDVFPALRSFPDWLGTWLQRRGLSEAASLQAYLQPRLQLLPDPATLADLQPAVARLQRAIAGQESIVIYGDYDVDGVCSAALTVECLRLMGAQATYYIPDRRAEGYGLNGEAMQQLAGRHQLLVTVDCGIGSVAEVALAQQLGLDVIVVDHHQVPSILPPAVACINPHRPDCAFPFKGLCAAGVAFLLMAGLRRALRAAGAFAAGGEPDLRQVLDLVAVATVADMVPICDTNRVLVAAGLAQVPRRRRPGLLALCTLARCDPEHLTATDVGFRIGPRINARGRMHHAGAAVELMLTDDPVVAATLAASLDAANQERRTVERATLEAAVQQVEAAGPALAAALVLYDPSWHPGVLGLVASRLASRFHRPALVIGEGGKGSGRSIEGLNLHAALQAVSTHLLKFGGHPAAAGVTVATTAIPGLRSALVAAVTAQLGGQPLVPTLRPDAQLTEAALSLETVDLLERLAPFGQGNPEPLFVARQLQVRRASEVGDGHLKMTLGQGGLDAIGFGMAPLLPRLGPSVDAIFQLERNAFRGRVRLQLRLHDLRDASM